MVDQYSVPVDGAEEPETLSADPALGVEEPTSPAPIAGGTERPEGLPENYESVQAMADALAEATRKITELGQAAGASEDPVALPELIRAATEESAAGGLTEATLKSFEKLGVGPEDAALMVQAKQALDESRDNATYEVFGGREMFEEFSKWAPENLSTDEINTLNALIVDQSPNSAVSLKLAVDGLMPRFNKDNPRVESGAASRTAAAIEPCPSKIEAMKVVASAAYKSGDRTTHDLHQRRLALTPGLFS